MSNFIRKLKEPVIEYLLNSDLFVNKLKSDLESGVVFMTIRNDYVSFYFQGCGLFKLYKNQFSTNIKYAFIPSPAKSSYITVEELSMINPVRSFVDAYDEIKKQCSLYAKLEASGVSTLYQNSITSKRRTSDNIYLLDIEVAFSKDDLMPEENMESNKDNRIDILLYDNKKSLLCFCEAKDCSNRELNLKGDPKEAPVIKQIERYNKRINDDKENIIEQYANHIRIMNRIFGFALSSPEDIFPRVGLYVFGYGRQDEKGIKKHILSIQEKHTIPSYTKGNPATVNIDNLYKRISKLS